MDESAHSTDKSRLLRCSGELVALAAVLIAAAFSATPTAGVPIADSGEFQPGSAPGKAPASRAGQQSTQARTGEGLLRQAEAHFGNGQFEKALQECERVIQLNPHSAEAYYLLGVIQDRRGSVEEARQALRRSLDLDPARPEVHIYLGELLLHAKQFDEAGAEFRSALKLGDDADAEAHFGLALALISKSQYKEALPYLTAAVEASPKDLQRQVSLAAADVELGRLDDTRIRLRQVESLAPESPEIFYRLGVLLFEHHMSGEAESELGRAARLLEEARAGPAPPEVSPAVLYLDLAELRFKHKNYWEALRDLDKIQLTTLSPKYQAEVLRFQAGALLAVGKPEQSLAKIREAAQRDPVKANDLIQQAWAELLSGDLKAAKDSIRIASDKTSYSPDLRQTAALIAREGLPARSKIPMSQDWHLTGEGLVCCPCKVPCPCRSNAPPSEGHCETAAAFRIDHGHYGKVRLDGFVYVTVTGAMDTLDTPLTVLVDQEATDEQLIALERIYQAFDPLHPFMFLTVERAPISFNHSSESPAYEVEVPGRVHLKIQRQLDEQGRPLMRTAALDYLSNTIEYAQNLTDKVWDKDGALRWDFSHRQANLRFIDLDARDYRGGTMLVQFYNYSGFFNPKQLELIKALNLPMLSSYPGSKQ